MDGIASFTHFVGSLDQSGLDNLVYFNEDQVLESFHIQVTSSIHGLILRSNFSFSYNGVYWGFLMLSICDVIVNQKTYTGE